MWKRYSVSSIPEGTLGLIHALGEFQSNSDFFFFFLMKKKKFVEREDRNSLV